MVHNTAVDIVDVAKKYGDRFVLEHVSLQIESTSRTVVLGHNGAGKSTLLEIIATLRTPTTGSVSVGGYDTIKQARDARRLIGLTPQSNALDLMATTSQVLRFHGIALGLGRRASAVRCNDLLELFGLTTYRGVRVAELSGGTRRKVDLAVALMAEPPIVILDEPTIGLDPLSRLDFWNELTRLNNAGTTLLVSTQDLHEADVLASDIIVLRDGCLAARGTPSTLKYQVGERTLTVELTDSVASKTLLTSARASFRADPESPHVVRLALPDTADALTVALADISRVASHVEELSINEPSLDDVFVSLAAR